MRALRLLPLVALSLASAATLARPLDAVQKSGALRVAVYLDYKPYSYRENGQPKGIDVDIAQALADALKLRLDLFELRADDDVNDDLRNGVWKGTVFGAAPGDVMLHIPYDPRIAKDNDRIALFAPYHVDGVAMYVDPAKAEAGRDLTLLKTDKVAVAVGTLADWVLASAQNHAYLPHIVHERSLEQAAAHFERGDVDAFYGEQSAGQSFARAGKRAFTVVHPELRLASDWTLGVAVKSDARDLGQEIALKLGELESSGKLESIFAAYGVDWRQPEAAR
ncbi:MAG: transporter substrate-binding domain-containing protein [Pseudomonadota bacterium]|nr:transporter substrate-binding domain-containing protein [Pseudomonadota bacterium]